MTVPIPGPHPQWFDPAMPSREQCVLPALLAARAAATPDRDYLLYEDGKRWTYGATYSLARRAAAALRRRGVRAGDQVLVWLPNGPDAVRAWFGANLVGACFAPLNIAYRGMLLEHAIRTSGATVMIAHAGLVERLQGIDARQLQVYGTEILDEDDDGAPDAHVERWDPQMLIFTSGTTGPSKGVLCTYLQIHTAARVQYGYMKTDDCMLIELPMFHIGGVGSISGTLIAGCCAVLCESFSTDCFWERVHRFGATTTSGLIGSMPAFLARLPPSPSDKDNTLRFAVMPLSRQAIEIAQRFDFHYCSGFNMTELSVPLVPTSTSRSRAAADGRAPVANAASSTRTISSVRRA
jgi:carnitine-CoA ligase